MHCQLWTAIPSHFLEIKIQKLRKNLMHFGLHHRSKIFDTMGPGICMKCPFPNFWVFLLKILETKS